ncbi:MAG: ABC transporter ATP-binding protein [Clostridiales bacterium]|nr:ABC transporter ATP-binding protein [Candidatus Cacconaster stercorequi]
MSEKEIAIQLKNVSKKFALFKSENARLKAMLLRKKPEKEKIALNNVSLEIPRGESVALFGRNGAGKSTLLKMITGVIYPTVGYVRVNGRVSALLELSAGFDPELTGRENIYFRGQIMGVSKAEIRELEGEIIDFAELGDYMDQPVRTYSSGMRARLGFAINASIRPDILIVDEALSVGDKIFRKKCNAKVREVLNNGTTFLFVTHSLASAKSFCKRGVVMRHGQIVYDGDIDSAADFYDRMRIES